MVDYIRDLRRAKWGSGVSLHGSNPEPLMSALPPKADIGAATRSPRRRWQGLIEERSNPTF